MKYALLFRTNEEPIWVSAEDVLAGKYNSSEEFVDPEYEFRVQFVRSSRNNGAPYFRLYYSYEEYKKLFPTRASRYEIVANMRKFEESQWHKKWKEKMSDFCCIEKAIKNPLTKKWKIADAFIDKTKTCIEFQHSYIALDFEERNKFYDELKYRIVWLYDLSYANTRKNEQGYIEILEDNSKGFFRVSENPDNLRNHFVYIQVKSGLIYRIRKLNRLDISSDKKSTIRYFASDEVYTEKEFIAALKNNSIITKNNASMLKHRDTKSLNELWDKKYRYMIVKNVETDKKICINHNGVGGMYRDFNSKCIKYKYVENNGYKSFFSNKEYFLTRKDEQKAIWLLMRYGEI